MDNNSGHRSQNVSVVTSHYLGGPWNCKGIASFALSRNKVLILDQMPIVHSWWIVMDF